MKQEKYLEFNVQIDGGKIIEKMPTARKVVMIYEHEAERLNSTSRQTRLYYELAKKEEVKKEPEKETKEKEEVVVVAKIDIPQPFDAESFVKTAKLESFATLTDEDLESALSLMSKKSIIAMFGIEVEEKKIALTKHEALKSQAKEIVTSLKH